MMARWARAFQYFCVFGADLADLGSLWSRTTRSNPLSTTYSPSARRYDPIQSACTEMYVSYLLIEAWRATYGQGDQGMQAAHEPDRGVDSERSDP
jgi:hypothetical protein